MSNLIIFILVAIPITAILIRYLNGWANRRIRPAKQQDFPNFRQAQTQAPHDLQAHSQLVSLCLGDSAKVERLIQYEIEKQPHLNRAEATRYARDRLETGRSR